MVEGIGDATLDGMSLRAGIEHDVEGRGKEGSSEMHWSWKLHMRPFQGSKTIQCVLTLPGVLGSKAEGHAMVISAPDPSRSFDYVHLGNPSFPYLYLSCSLTLESKFGVH